MKYILLSSLFIRALHCSCTIYAWWYLCYQGSWELLLPKLSRKLNNGAEQPNSIFHNKALSSWLSKCERQLRYHAWIWWYCLWLSNLWHLSLHSVNFEQRRDRDVMQLDHEREKVSAGGKNKRLDRASLAYHTEWWRPLTKIFIPPLIWGPDMNRLCLGGLIEIETNIKPALFIHVKDE